MKIEKFEGNDERRIMTAMIVDDQVLSKIAPRWPSTGLFPSEWSNRIGNVCIEHFRKYGKAPGKAMGSLYEKKIEPLVDDDTKELIARYLKQLSDNYESRKKQINPAYLIDVAHAYFNRVRLMSLSDSIKSDVEALDIDKAMKRLNTFSHLDLGSESAVDILDPSNVESVFASKGEALIEWDGALGNFINDNMRRDEFIAFMAPEKTGKTWWLIETAWRALTQGRRVAFFEVGDMSQGQLLNRFYTRIAKHPSEPCLVKKPTFLNHDPDTPTATTEFEEIEFTEGLTPERAKFVMGKAQKKYGKDKLKLSVHANTSINVAGMESVLQTWEREAHWTPDVILVDYADILAPPVGVAETRDQINATWKQLRAMSQRRHCLVVTATQTDADSYKVGILSRSNFSEDKRKFAHVTGMLGLNVSEEDKDNQITRLNWILRRERKFSDSKICHVAGCLDLGAPAILSSF
jgi:replicative DNA helicase